MLPRLHALIRLRPKIHPIDQRADKHRANRHHDARILHDTAKPACIPCPEHSLCAWECGGDDDGKDGLHGEIDGEGRALQGRELGTWEDFECNHAGDEGLG